MTPFALPERIQSRANYDRLRQTFRWECPEYFNFGFDVVDHWAEAAPDHLAIYYVSGEEKKRSPFRKSPTGRGAWLGR